MYQAACVAAMTSLATDVYDQLAAIDTVPFTVTAVGTAVGIDSDGDGAMDAIAGGLWTGTISYATFVTPLVGSTFLGSR